MHNYDSFSDDNIDGLEYEDTRDLGDLSINAVDDEDEETVHGYEPGSVPRWYKAVPRDVPTHGKYEEHYPENDVSERTRLVPNNISNDMSWHRRNQMENMNRFVGTPADIQGEENDIASLISKTRRNAASGRDYNFISDIGDWCLNDRNGTAKQRYAVFLAANSNMKDAEIINSVSKMSEQQAEAEVKRNCSSRVFPEWVNNRPSIAAMQILAYSDPVVFEEIISNAGLEILGLVDNDPLNKAIQKESIAAIATAISDDINEFTTGDEWLQNVKLLAERYGYIVGFDTLTEKKKKNWIQKAINPAHKGYCTPMSKSTCTPRRKALAKRFKKGGDLHK